MAITTLDGVIAGLQAPQPFIKSGITMAAVAVQRAYTPWYVGANPGASVANAAGVNGQAVTPGLGTSVGGRIRRTNPVSGNAYLGRLSAQANTILADRPALAELGPLGHVDHGPGDHAGDAALAR